MPDSPKVKTRFACHFGILPVAVMVLCGWMPVSAQDAGEAVTEKAEEEKKEPPVNRSLSFTEKVLRPLAKEVIIEDVFEGGKAKNMVVQVDLTHQMLTVTVSGQVAITCPVTTGRRTQPTRPDTHTVSGRVAKLEPSGYGHFVDRQGRIMVRGVYQRLDSPPAGLMFVETRQSYALNLGKDAPRILAGHVRSTACTNGDIIVSEKVALTLFKKVPDGTKVLVTR